MTIHKLWLRSNLLQLGYRAQFKLSKERNGFKAIPSQSAQEALLPTIEAIQLRLKAGKVSAESEYPKQFFVELPAGEKHGVLIVHYLMRNTTDEIPVYRLNQAFEIAAASVILNLHPFTGDLEIAVSQDQGAERLQYKTKIESDGKMKLHAVSSKSDSKNKEPVKTKSPKLETAKETVSETTSQSTDVMTPQSRQETLKSRLIQLESEYNNVRMQLAIVRGQLVLAEIQQQAQSRPWQPLPASVMNEAELLSYLLTTRHSKADVIDLTARRLAAVLGLEFQ